MDGAPADEFQVDVETAGGLVINLPRDRGKVLCAPTCCGRRRNVTTTKVKFCMQVFLLVAIVALDTTIIILRMKKDGAGTFGPEDAALVVTALVAVLEAKPTWGRVGESVERITDLS